MYLCLCLCIYVRVSAKRVCVYVCEYVKDIYEQDGDTIVVDWPVGVMTLRPRKAARDGISFFN